MISGVNMMNNNVNFEGRFSNMKERYQDMSKKDKAKVVAATVAGATALTTAVILRKDLGHLIKTRNFKQFRTDAAKTLTKAFKSVVEFLKHPIKAIKKAFSKTNDKPVRTVFSDEPGLSNDTKKSVKEGLVEIANNIVKDMEDMCRRYNSKGYDAKQKELEEAFRNSTGIESRKDVLAALAEKKPEAPENIFNNDLYMGMAD